MTTRSRVFHRANPAVYNILVYYAVNPWSATPDGFMCVPLNARVTAIPRGRYLDRLEVQLVIISPVHNTSMPDIPQDKQSRIHLSNIITQEMQRLTDKSIDPVRSKLVDFDED